MPPHGRLVQRVDALQLGIAVVELGGGRRRPEDAIDHAVGITGLVDIGVKLDKGAPIATIHAQDEKALETARNRVLAAYEIAENAPDVAEPIAERILG